MLSSFVLNIVGCMKRDSSTLLTIKSFTISSKSTIIPAIPIKAPTETSSFRRPLGVRIVVGVVAGEVVGTLTAVVVLFLILLLFLLFANLLAKHYSSNLTT